MLETILISTLVNFVETSMFKVESCNGQKFTLIESVEPKWPLHTERFKFGAFVDIEFIVDAEGNVKTHKVSRAEPARVFDRESVRALKKWKFNSSKYSERCFEVRFNFKPLD
jgi:TonB family protein